MIIKIKQILELSKNGGYKLTSKWKFQEQQSFEEVMFNSSLEKFYNFKVEGIVRENLQNSLDARNKENDNPVLIKINLGEIETEKLPGISEITERIPSLKGANEYTNETIESMKCAIKKDKVRYISFEDENTKGLKYKDDLSDTWKAYAYKKGVHNIDSDSNHEMHRGGSHGIGKIASNAASELYILYFANCDEEGNRHLGGTVQFIEHKYKEKIYRATGYYTENLTQQKPFVNNEEGVFRKATRGLKLIIPYYRDEFGEEKDIIKSICNNFFVAILENKLIVEVNGKIISKETIEMYIQNEEYYVQDISSKDAEVTPLYFETYKFSEKEVLTVKDKRKEYSFELYFKYDESIPKGRVAIVRSVGMKIEDFKIVGSATKPFNAVLIPSNLECDKFLKSLENESHTELSYKHFKQKEHGDNAKRFINNLGKRVKEVLDEYIKENNQTDGKIETDDVLYEMENNFKKILNEANVVYDTGISTIIKRKPEKRAKRQGNGDTKIVINKPVNTRKYNKTTDDDSREKEAIYSIAPYYVKRALVGNREIMEIDLSQSIEIKDGKKVDLLMKVIDGMGKEHDSEFRVEQSYIQVLDKADSMNKTIKENKIENIIVKESKVRLDLTLDKSFNKSLKFAYYLEV